MAAFQNALGALLSPLAWANLDLWRAEATTRVSALLGADKASFLLPKGAWRRIVATGFRDDEIGSYPARLEPLDARIGSWRRQLRLGVWHREKVYHDCRDEYYGSEFYNDYIVSIRAFDALGITLATDHRRDQESVASLFFHHGQERGPKFGDRGMLLLRMLYPAFDAGVRIALAVGEARQGFRDRFEEAGDAMAACSLDGCVLEENAALRRLLDQDPERDAVLRRVESMATDARRSLDRACIRSIIEDGCLRGQQVHTSSRRYQLRAGFVTDGIMTPAPLVLVTISLLGDPELPADRLNDRFGLTRRECEVGRLLAQGCGTREIAARLGVSIHTVRRHTEHVLAKLGVSSRAAVNAKLTGMGMR